MVLYNDNDVHVCQWLHNLIAHDLLPPGEVQCADICEMGAGEMRGTSHLFAGIGGWPLALRMAGWPDDRPVWTASLPCQPFSSAGKRKGTDDDRHLWPTVRGLVAECKPPTIFGEQVASRLGRDWFARVRADLEALGYAVGCADLCAAGVGAPHIRQRLFWVADAEGCYRGISVRERGQDSEGVEPRGGGEARVGLGDGIGSGLEGHSGHVVESEKPGWVGANAVRSASPPGWNDQPCGLVRCIEPGRDGQQIEKWRRAPVEPGLFPLAHGLPGGVVAVRSGEAEVYVSRLAALKGAGNAIVPQVGAAFVRAFMDSTQ